jgi:hypothetical protein
MFEVLKSKAVLIAITIALVVGALGALGIEASCRTKAVTHQEQVADTHGAAADAHQGQAVIQDAKIDDLKAPLAAARAATQQAKATVAQLEQALADEKAKPGPVDLSSMVSSQNALIVGLRDVNGKLLVQINVQEQMTASTTASRDEWRTAAVERQGEAQALRSALTASKAMQKHWGAGGSWNPGDRTYGTVVEYDFGSVPVRVGAQVYQQRLPIDAGGGVKGAAQVWLVVKF